MESSALERPALPEDMWCLEDIFPSDDAFRAEKRRVESILPGVETWRGRLSESAAVMADALAQITERSKEIAHLHAYASMRSDEDTRLAGRQQQRLEVELLVTDFGRRIAWLRPEILALEPTAVETFIASEPRIAVHAHFLRDLLRQRPHVLSPAEERIVAEAGLVTKGANAIFGILQNAEMPRPDVVLEDGTTVRVTPASFAQHRATPVRADRARLFEAYFGSHAPFRGTLGQNLFECLKSHMFRARVRGYPSCLAAALDTDAIPTTVYTNLLKRVRESLPVLHRYFRLRARALGLDHLEYHDQHCPILAEPARTYTVADAGRLVLDAMEPMGPEYGAALGRSLGQRWIDWHPAPGKRSGAYASGAAYDVHPYMLLNFHGDFESVSTLAHEAGHAMHSFFSNTTQPYATADYSIFVAEVASTFNEALLAARMLEEAETREDRIFLLTHWLDGMRATLFRQTFFAEFELAIHDKAEGGEALTGESLSALYLHLLREHQGHDLGGVRVADYCGIEWACVPHFYYDFYVYQYATGIVAATSLSESVLRGEPGARDRYLDFLRAGGSDYPLEVLRRAGVDLESPGPYEATVRAMTRRLDELQALLDA